MHDTEGDGWADKATVFAEFPKSGAQGIYFDEEGLVVSGDQGVRRWRDRDGDGKADGEPELFFRTAHGGEHGAHGIVKGPDGWFYLVAGNLAEITSAHATLPGSPQKQVTAGAIMRFSPNGGASEVVAHGFRNAYDLDFHLLGQLITYDSDGERDHHLPWYSGTRIFNVVTGASHGWLLKASNHAWNQPESWFDNTARLWTVGRGSPTGVVCYRHRAFPARYREGVFTLCWTMGRVYFSPLTCAGSTFSAQLETFMEAEGTGGFAPVDAVVGPTGDLFVATGGRGSTGTVFRVRYTGASTQPSTDRDPLRDVLAADQPLSSWSRAMRVPQAKRLGARAFDEAAGNTHLPTVERIRAIEVLVEVFGGLRPETARPLARSDEPEIVARVAWALPRSAANPQPRELLAELTHGNDPRIARAAWEALQSVPTSVAAIPTPDWWRGLDSDDRLVRAATVQAAQTAGVASFVATPFPENPTARQRLGQLKIVEPERSDSPEWRTHYFDTCLDIFATATQLDARIDAVRLLQIGLGDVTDVIDRPGTSDGFVAARIHDLPQALRANARSRLAPIFLTSDAALDRELARLQAMLETDAPGLLERITDRITAKSAVEDDLHYLMAAARLPGIRITDTTTRIARAVAGLHHKMIEDKKEPSRYWGTHVGEMFARLLARDPALPAALLARPNFNLSQHALFASRFPTDQRTAAARLLLEGSTATRTPTSAMWTREWVDFLGVLPDDELFPALRAAWSITALHDSLTLVLARSPQPEDRGRFAEALGSFQPAVVERAARALQQLPGAGSPHEIAEAVTSLRRLCRLQNQKSARGALVELLPAWAGEKFATAEGADLVQSYSSWFEWFARKYPSLDRVHAGSDENFPAWGKRLAAVNWDAGEATRGRRIYEERLCLRCHGSDRIGPDLTGIAARLSREDLFAAILEPSRDISPTWQGKQFRVRNGTTYIGVVVYESPTATLIQVGADATIRLTGDEIVSVETSRISLMPPGLLNGLEDGEMADFYAFLRTLK